ncbi:phosphoribosylaminoimidazole carboxylase [Catenaria anguillulae PL171]|uniref:Phosphoribosylaminoimidazole carboxylase n=1 Tax=Catenaria anguillulae PL171 TaxID=765915 RepID=A0A1Y2HU90_9FUNG|nr:phosphoribosylaminoimidazole carboxylase [Catenaria anguillulae PL171]
MNSRRIGVLGGGQLGRMLIESAHRLNVSVVCLDSDPATPAKQLLGPPVAGTIDCGAFSNAADIRKFVSQSKIDVLTVEIEHVDTHVLDELEAEGKVEVHPAPSTIRVIQDKFAQKEHLTKHGVPTSKYAPVPSVESLQSLAKEWGLPLMLKSKRWAYDGRGNYAVHSEEDIAKAYETLNPKADPEALYAEAWCPFERELAVMVVRDRQGHVVAYPTVETVHTRNICHVVVAPAQIDGLLAARAQEVAKMAVASLSGAGIFGVEMFYLASGEILLNEIAPRPHNSGHYTQDACNTSQFENHVRVLAGLPIGSTDLKVPYAAMLNILGHVPMGDLQRTLASAHASVTVPGSTVHLYGKPGCRADRKMGHINLVAQTFPELQSRMAQLLAADLGVSVDDARNVILPSALRQGAPKVGIIMGSDSDLPVMRAAAHILRDFDVPFELTIVSAHRTPLRMVEYAQQAAARGIQVIIAGAGGAAHLPGMVAAVTPLPVIGVPVALKVLDGQDSLYSIVQMPRGVPVATVAINNSTNAGLLAVRMLGAQSRYYREKMAEYLKRQEAEVLGKVDRLAQVGWEEYKA